MAPGLPSRVPGGKPARTPSPALHPSTDPIQPASVDWALPTAPPLLAMPSVGPALDAGALALAPPSFVLGDFWPLTMAAPAAGAPRTNSNSDMAVRADLARARYGVSGAGIRVGILSDSFNLRGGMAADQARGDLPAGVRILSEGRSGHDEGRAMADLVHRIAPDAQILFHSATNGEADFAAGITALAKAGCNVIVDDVAYLDEPFFQDGSAVQVAVERAVAGGASYFTAASNEGRNFIQQGFRGLRTTLPGLPAGVTVQNFAPGGASQPWLDVTLPTYGRLILALQWDQPFASIGGGKGAANSLGLALYDTQGHLVAAASGNCVGGDPAQTLSFLNTTGGTQFRLVVWQNGGTTPPGLFKIIDYGSGQLTGPGVGQGSGTVIGHEMVPGGNTVGAVAWSDSARFGGRGTVEPFSSIGTGNILFSASGARLAQPLTPAKVNFTAPDGSVTSVFAPFYGTSAAAPCAAAVAALMLQADPALTPAQVTSVLTHTAAAGGGGAFAVGAGLVQADAAVGLALSLAHGGH